MWRVEPEELAAKGFDHRDTARGWANTNSSPCFGVLGKEKLEAAWCGGKVLPGLPR